MQIRSFLTVAFGLLALQNLTAGSVASYQPLTQVPIPGEGGWDILSVDSAAHRLYLSHATKVIVVDLEKNILVGEIEDTPGVHAFLAISELGRGFSSNGKENKASVVDLKTLKTISKIETGDGPDAMVYDAKRGELYVFNHKGNSATVINAKDAEVVATIPLAGSPEFGAVDEAAGRVFVNLEDKSALAVIDAATHAVVATWPLTPGEEPTGLAFDASHHRLFASCNNKLLAMVDSHSGKVVGTAPIGEHVDGCAFDEATQLAFASCGEGVTTIVHEDGPDKLSIVQTLATKRSARTIALDPTTHRIYLPAADYQPAPSPAPGASPTRPAMVPGSMKLLVFGPA